LASDELRAQLADAYKFPVLARSKVVIGFNGSEKLGEFAPTIDELQRASQGGAEPESIWRAVIWRAVQQSGAVVPNLSDAIETLSATPQLYAETLSKTDDALAKSGDALVIVFDALDRLALDWEQIRGLTKGLLIRTLGLQSFRAIRAKVFMRVDQFSDNELFRFPDSSKLRNDSVFLAWRPHELYGLLLFELLREPDAAAEIKILAERTDSVRALPSKGRANTTAIEEQATLIAAIAGEFMGTHKKRGRVYTWVPLHLSDAANNCSPRTFLTAWKTAADHVPPPSDRAVDHLGLIDGVRRASGSRLTELREDFPWIDWALEPLRRQFVPIGRKELFNLWAKKNVVERILAQTNWLAPVNLSTRHEPLALLQAMVSIAVMEERANGKINVPDIFRVEAEILRRGGVAVPRRH
jgi:hypothetical protein